MHQSCGDAIVMTGSLTKPNPESPSSKSPPGPAAIQLNRILVPVDFSPASRHGVAFAAILGERFQSRLHLLHVIEPPLLPQWGYAHLARRDAKLSHAAAERMLQFPAESGIDPQLICSTDILIGEADNKICEAAAKNSSDLIVLASHGLGGLPHVVLGSTAESVVRRAPCSVLTVRDCTIRETGAGTPRFGLKRILVTTDFSNESKKAFPYAVALARRFDASLVLLTVVPAHLPMGLGQIGSVYEEKRLLAEAHEQMPQFRQAEFDPELHVETLVLNGGPAHEICRTAATLSVDLIVMATHGRTGLRHLVLGSMTEHVVRHSPCPVLAVRERQ